MAKKKKKAKARDPRVIMAEKQAEIERMQSKIAQEEAAANPVFDPIRERIEDLQKQQIVHAKGFGSGPQSFDNRVQAKQLWIDQINAERELAKNASDSIKDEIQRLRATLPKLIADGADKDMVSLALTAAYKGAQETFPDIANLEKEVVEATESRKNFSTLVKTPTRKRKTAEEAN